jgi:hypothetical protein
MNTGEIPIYQKTESTIKPDVRLETVKTPEESYVYRNLCLRMIYDPGRGRTFSTKPFFYKHTIPLGLNTINLIASSTPEGSNVYRKGCLHKGFDPGWGRTFPYYTISINI